ncbi:L-idonate 5-dehydrogenase [Azohydromonas lata]|uniref:L-idonate 5-dehydrogenase n=1 Tax=Azohydromonas lata TaxID=45677 RepID=UPI00082B9EDA|nr:L-idonate 5-dehydrogenase [Azohydromonas lata]
MSSTSTVCRIHAALDLRLSDETLPVPGPHEVRLRLGAGGICGSDLHYWQHGRVGAFVIREPLIPGHEASGIVDATGPGVTRVVPGQRVAINPSHACGRCDYCRAGRLNLCRNMFFLGSASVFPHAQGMFRSHFLMGEAQLTPVEEAEVSLGEIACAEPLSIGLHAVDRAGPLLSRTVLVMGGGTIGCMSVLAARLAGAARVIVADVADRPLQSAREVGADETLRVDQIAPADLADLADVSIEAAGNAAALASCFAATRRGGRIVQVGTLPPEVTLPLNQVMARELDFVGAFRANHEFDWAVQAIRTRRVDVRPLISAQLPLAQADEAFHLAADRGRSTKVQLVG